MFTSFRIQNFRTHRDTFFKLKDLTLLMGRNGSGKTNLLHGLAFFSERIREACVLEEKELKEALDLSHYFDNRHLLDEKDTPMSFQVEGTEGTYEFSYTLKIYPEHGEIFCQESLVFNEKSYAYGTVNASGLLLYTKLQKDTALSVEEHKAINSFFRSLSSLCYLNLQPAFLKGKANFFGFEGQQFSAPQELFETDKTYPIHLEDVLGEEGANFLSLLAYVKEEEQEVYNRFVGFLKRFEPSFVAIKHEKKRKRTAVYWQFDMETDFPYFTSDKVSDGFIKAAAVALLCAMKNPPALIMLEEVENGINQRNIEEFMGWLISASRVGRKPQFIVTSHSPSVLRLFADRLDCVYNVHLRKKKGFVSEIGNLNEAIVQLVKFGAFNENDIKGEVDGVVHLAPITVAELFYDGVIGSM